MAWCLANIATSHAGSVSTMNSVIISTVAAWMDVFQATVVPTVQKVLTKQTNYDNCSFSFFC